MEVQDDRSPLTGLGFTPQVGRCGCAATGCQNASADRPSTPPPAEMQDCCCAGTRGARRGTWNRDRCTLCNTWMPLARPSSDLTLPQRSPQQVPGTARAADGKARRERGKIVEQHIMRLLKPSLCSLLLPKLLAVGFKPPPATSTSSPSLPWGGTGSKPQWITDADVS